jgi:hypothetical protein
MVRETHPTGAIVKIRVMMAGRGYPSAQTLPEWLNLPDGCSVDHALEAVAALIGNGKGPSASSLVAVSGSHLGTVRNHRPRELRDGDELTIIAPVAGG